MRWVLTLAAGVLALVGSGCSFLSSLEREYTSNRDLIQAASECAGFTVDPSLFELTGLDLREDSLTFQLRGVRHPGDHAWVVRFSEKSSEQNPLAVSDVYSLLSLIGEGRTGFRIVEEADKDVLGERAKYVRYVFESPIHDGDGKALQGHGIVASVRLPGASGPLVQHMKLDNHGDRDDVQWDDLAPFLPRS